MLRVRVYELIRTSTSAYASYAFELEVFEPAPSRNNKLAG